MKRLLCFVLGHYWHNWSKIDRYAAVRECFRCGKHQRKWAVENDWVTWPRRFGVKRLTDASGPPWLTKP